MIIYKMLLNILRLLRVSAITYTLIDNIVYNLYMLSCKHALRSDLKLQKVSILQEQPNQLKLPHLLHPNLELKQNTILSTIITGIIESLIRKEKE